MNLEILNEFYQTEQGRKEILFDIINQDSISITKLVEMKEQAMKEREIELNKLISGLALRASSMFGIKPSDVLKNIELVKPLIALDIIKSGVVKGTPFEQELIEQYKQ